MLIAEPMLTSEVADLLGVSPDRVRQLEREGVLLTARTTTGVRIFNRAEVVVVAADREAKKVAKAAAANAAAVAAA